MATPFGPCRAKFGSFPGRLTYSSIFGGKVVEKLFELIEQRGRKVPLDSADAIPTGCQSRAAEFVEPIHQNFTIAETIEKHGHGSDVERLGAEPKLMADDPLDFRHDRAQVFRPVRHGNIHELFDGAAVGEIVVHRADVVEPVGMRNELMIGAVFRQLFHTAVQDIPSPA